MRTLKPRSLSTIFGLLALAILNLTARNQAFAASESVLWSFLEGGEGGLYPQASLIMDKDGNLYGTTPLGGAGESHEGYGSGTVFKLTPPATGGSAWTESILWSFGNGSDGFNPYAGLIMDASGNLYGTTTGGGAYGGRTVLGEGGAYGTVFKLTPPATSGAIGLRQSCGVSATVPTALLPMPV